MAEYHRVVTCRSINDLDLDILGRDGFLVQKNLYIHIVESIRIAPTQSALHVTLSCVTPRWELEEAT